MVRLVPKALNREQLFNQLFQLLQAREDAVIHRGLGARGDNLKGDDGSGKETTSENGNINKHMYFDYSRLEKGLKELGESTIPERRYLAWCLTRFCPGPHVVSEPTLGQVLAGAYASWVEACKARGVPEEEWKEPLPIPEG